MRKRGEREELERGCVLTVEEEDHQCDPVAFDVGGKGFVIEVEVLGDGGRGKGREHHAKVVVFYQW